MAENKIHSKWNNADIAGLIPELTDALKNPDNIDPQQVKAGVDAFLGKQYDAIQALLASDDLRKFQESNNPQALLNVLSGMEDYWIANKQIQGFAHTASLHYRGKDEDLKPAMDSFAEKIQGINGCLGQLISGITQMLAKLSDADLAKMIVAEPKIANYEAYIDKIRNAPSPDHEKMAALNVDGFYGAIAKCQQSGDHKIEADARNNLVAEGLCGILDFKQKAAEANGFGDTLTQFSFTNSAPHDMIDNLVAASEKKSAAIKKSFSEIRELAADKLKNGYHGKQYSWNEAKDIVCSAYTKLDPELGKIAQRAFDEGWIYAPENGVPNPMTLAIMPNKQNANAHPFMATNFSGNGMEIVFLGHEMAHVISNYIAGQKEGALTSDASMIVQESFSGFGEKLVEKEMIGRTKTEQEKANLQLLFLKNDTAVFPIISQVKLEEDLYKLVKEKDGKASFAEIQQLYGDNTPDFWQIIMQPPHNMAVYPITKIMSSALFTEYEKEPEKFRGNYKKIMEAGGTIGVSQLWDKLLGNGKAEQKEFIEKRVDEIATHLEELRDKLHNMSYLPESPPLRPVTGTFLDRYEGAKREGMGHRRFV